ncbi:cytochrome P450 [Mycena belliarum]|uniref:Cytochrome P450 n=1 Tax=Mycena belliarum TaxID=1033014 RepID=A0AAD6TSK2_9AGAR|nr:cytochrome P450 [Mycena belliae]
MSRLEKCGDSMQRLGRKLSTMICTSFTILFGLPLMLGLIITARSYKHARKGKLPPGPKGWPIIGNLLQLRGKKSWLQFAEWRRRYGDIFYINLAGQDTVVISSLEIASELLERRAGIYSDRARNIVAGELLTGGLVFAFSQHNDAWKRQRRGAHEALNKQVVKAYCPLQETEAILLISQYLSSPGEWESHLRRASMSLVHSIMYGLPPVLDSEDPDILRVNRFTVRALEAAAPGAFLVDSINWLEYLPRWMSPWRRYAEAIFKADSILFDELFEDVRRKVEAGDETPSVASSMIRDQESLNLTNREAAWVSATLFAGGSGTTPAQLSWFMLAMVLYPEVQRRAQAELDRVVGRGRLPTFKDYDNLPYIRAVVKETLRWNGIAPLSIPHRLSQDDYYEGYFLPKGTLCIVNAWSLHHEKAIYGSNAYEFEPARYLVDDHTELRDALPDTREEGHHGFGFGRRICVGRHVVNNTMFIDIACILWSFHIEPTVNEKGEVFHPDPMDCIDEGLVVRPKPFPCSITPRNEDVESVVLQAKELHGYV